MSSISFDNVYLLFIALPLLIIIAVPFALAVRRDNVNGHNIASMVLHVLMAVLIAFAAAGTQIVTVMTETNVYVVADVSYSANRNLDAVDGYISEIRSNLPRNSKLGVICFGKDYKVTTKLGEKVQTVKECGVDDTETNVVNALEYAATQFKEGVIKRIVLITDGRETYSDDPNALSRTVANLQAQDIKVDAIYLNDNWDETIKEVQISSADYTKSAYANHPETVSLTVNSSRASNSIINLSKDGEPYKSTTVTLSVGTNTVTFDLDTSEEGKHLYRAEISADGDGCGYNNVYSFTQTVTKAVNVLLVSADDKDYEEFNKLYDVGEDGQTTITHFNIKVNNSLPVSVEDLCQYDEIILSNVDLTEIENYGMFVSSLNTVVSAYGRSLLTFGNTGIQTAEGGLNDLDDMLPVRYGEIKEGMPKLYTIVMDVSDSMTIGDRGRLAKIAAKQLVSFLNDDDYVSVIAFADGVAELQIPTDLKGSNRDKVLEIIDTADLRLSGQGTYISLGLYKAMDNAGKNFSEKQVMLITDGLPYGGNMSYEDVDIEGYMADREYAKLFVGQMRAYDMYTSVLQVGSGTDSARSWLTELAFVGGGKAYRAEKDEELFDVLFGDIQKDSVNVEITNNASSVVKNKPRDEVLSVTDSDGGKQLISFDSAYINDYYLSKSKSSATTVLSVAYKDKGVTLNVPLYAYWNYGNGKVQSYTGKISEIMVKGGTHSADNNRFFGNVISSALPAEKSDVPFTVTSELGGKKSRIELNNLTYDQLQAAAVGSSSAQITITTPSGEQLTNNFIFDSSVFYYEFITPDVGAYDVKISYKYGIYDYSADAGFIISYEPEYDSFAVYEASVLYKMLNGSGSVIEQKIDGTLAVEGLTVVKDGLTIENGKLTIKNDDSVIATYVVNLTVPFLIAAVVLFVVDIIIRKLKWEDIVSLFGGGNNKGGAK